MSTFNIIINQSNDFYSFISPIIGVIISAAIAWIVYRKQSIEKEIKENIDKFSYLFYLITKNFEEIYSIKKQVTEPALKEIDNALDNLNNIEKELNWYKGVKNTLIIIPNDYRESYVNTELKKYSQNLSLHISTQSYIQYIDKKSFEKEATLLMHYGDLAFKSVCNKLDTNYNVIDEIQKKIYKNNDDIVGKYHSICINCSLELNIQNDEYKKQIEQLRRQLLYKKSLFEIYNKIANICCIYSYNAISHLDAFLFHYLNKYIVVFNKIGIPYKNIIISDEETSFDKEDFWNLFSVVKSYEYELFAMPLYNNLKRTLLDRISDFIFYLRWE